MLGTSSPRRAAQVRRERPDIQVAVLRGNVDTRLSRILSANAQAEGRIFDATILAVAGLHRMGLVEHAERPLGADSVLPAAGQGALALCCRAVDHVTLQRCLPLNSSRAATAVHAEREVVERLGADCYSPIAVLAEQLPPAQTMAKRNADAHWFRLRVRVLSADGQTCLDADEKCKTGDLRRLAESRYRRPAEPRSDRIAGRGGFGPDSGTVGAWRRRRRQAGHLRPRGPRPPARLPRPLRG